MAQRRKGRSRARRESQGRCVPGGVAPKCSNLHCDDVTDHRRPTAFPVCLDPFGPSPSPTLLLHTRTRALHERPDQAAWPEWALSDKPAVCAVCAARLTQEVHEEEPDNELL